MGACVAPASVEGLAIGLGVASLAALVPTEGYIDFIAILEKNTTEVRSRFRQFSERNLNPV